MEQTKTDEVKPNNNKKKKLGLVILAVIIIIGGVTAFFYLRYKATHISTDDAFIDGHIHTIASKVPGTVKKVCVQSNQFVKKGDVLVELDPVDYEVKLKEAVAKVGTERAKLEEAETQIKVSENRLAELDAALEAAKANLELRKADLEQAEKDSRRAENLYKSSTIPKQRYEKMMTDYDVALAKMRVAKEQVKQAEKAYDTQKNIVKQTKASKTAQISRIVESDAKQKAAKLNFGYTKIYAPVDGYVTKKSVEIGNQIQTGQPLMAVVPLTVDDIYITANYKETQLEKVKLGQKVEFEVDTFPGKTFKGKVDSIMSGTGSAFSLFPPENATGNYVKVVQRIPVKIVLDKDTDPGHVLRIGMSVVPTIIVE
jgi:membrane fusion protein (multidrug efflux system)